MASTITEMADRLKVRSDTLRFYERSGLIASSGRTSGGYRIYDDPVADRVRLIKSAQRSGLLLREIAELLKVMDQGDCPCGHTATVVAERIADVDVEIARLQDLRTNLIRLQHDNDACPNQPSNEWPCFTGFAKGGDA